MFTVNVFTYDCAFKFIVFLAKSNLFSIKHIAKLLHKYMRNTFSQKYAKNQILSDVKHAKYEMFTAFSNNVIKHLQKTK